MPNCLQEGLPKEDPKVVISELKSTLYSNDNFKKFFPDDREQRYRDNFKLFDRNDDQHLTLYELQELLISIGQIFEEDELLELFEELKDPEKDGINSDALFVLVSKKIRDSDSEALLESAFKILEPDQDDMIDSEQFKELLMTMGAKLNEEEADELLKEADPKGEGKFLYEDFIKKVMKR